VQHVALELRVDGAVFTMYRRGAAYQSLDALNGQIRHLSIKVSYGHLVARR
jgi:hypothetical protein